MKESRDDTVWKKLRKQLQDLSSFPTGKSLDSTSSLSPSASHLPPRLPFLPFLAGSMDHTPNDSNTSPSTSPSGGSSHLASRLEALAVSSRPASSSPLTQEMDRQDAQTRASNLDKLGDSHTGDWERGRVGRGGESIS
jgi:hypothetical protein